MAATLMQVAETQNSIAAFQEKLRAGNKGAYKAIKVLKKKLMNMRQGEVVDEDIDARS